MDVYYPNGAWLRLRKDVFDRFMKAYRDTIAYMYGDNPQVLKDYAEFAGVPDELAVKKHSGAIGFHVQFQG